MNSVDLDPTNTLVVTGTMDGKCPAVQLVIEWFSIECRKTKTKVITLANHKNTDNPVNQSKLD